VTANGTLVSKTQNIPAHVKYNAVTHTKNLSCRIWPFYLIMPFLKNQNWEHCHYLDKTTEVH